MHAPPFSLTSSPPVITTDGDDVEAMLLKSPAVEKVLIEYDLKVNTFGKNESTFPALIETGPVVKVHDLRLVQVVLLKNPGCRHGAADLR